MITVAYVINLGKLDSYSGKLLSSPFRVFEGPASKLIVFPSQILLCVVGHPLIKLDE